jgi:hypothetical protein
VTPYDRGYQDRATGHEQDAPLQAADRTQYLAGYREAGRGIYCTSFCNFGHYTDTGRPIGHECYVIPPKLLELEMMGEPWPEEDRRAWEKTRYFVNGRKRREVQS